MNLMPLRFHLIACHREMILPGFERAMGNEASAAEDTHILEAGSHAIEVDAVAVNQTRYEDAFEKYL